MGTSIGIPFQFHHLFSYIALYTKITVYFSTGNGWITFLFLFSHLSHLYVVLFASAAPYWSRRQFLVKIFFLKNSRKPTERDYNRVVYIKVYYWCVKFTCIILFFIYLFFCVQFEVILYGRRITNKTSAEEFRVSIKVRVCGINGILVWRTYTINLNLYGVFYLISFFKLYIYCNSTFTLKFVIITHYDNNTVYDDSGKHKSDQKQNLKFFTIILLYQIRRIYM